jgi:hypothetical protein
MLPKPLRDGIYATYTPGQTLGTASMAYRQNLREALNYLKGAAPALGGVELSAITIWQPWASLITIGAKPFEFRSWPAPNRLIGQRIAIQAGARAANKDEVRDLILRLQSSYWRETGLKREPALAFLSEWLPKLKAMPRSVIVCTGKLGTPIRNSEMERALGMTPFNDSDRDQHSMWGWPLTEIRVIDPPLPARGSQGFFKVTVPGDAAL